MVDDVGSVLDRATVRRQQDGDDGVADAGFDDIAIDFRGRRSLNEIDALPFQVGARLTRKRARFGSDENVSHPPVRSRSGMPLDPHQLNKCALKASHGEWALWRIIYCSTASDFLRQNCEAVVFSVDATMLDEPVLGHYSRRCTTPSSSI